MLIIGIVIYVVCCVLSFGIIFSFSQNEWPSIARVNYRGNYGMSLGVSLFGPISLLVCFFATGFAKHGLKIY